MNYEEFMEYTSPDYDVSNALYVLNVRKTDQIEYLVRYNDPDIHYDQWVKSSDLTCYKKILDYYEGKVPSTIVPRLMPESFQNEPAEIPPEDKDKFIIYGSEVLKNEIMLRVHIPGEEGIQTINSEKLKDKYSNEIIEYYETHYVEK